MTATADAPVRHLPPRTTWAAPLTAARMLRLELRRNAMPWILPLVAALFWFDSYRPSAATPPIWVLRTFWNMGQGHTIIDCGPFVAGVAAWMGSRDGRRGTTDLVTATPRPRYAAELATWAATAIWAVGAYLAFVGVMFAVYAYEGVHGSSPWWWVAVGATSVTAFSAAGFTIGALYRSRFAAALAAFGGFLIMTMSSQTGFSHTSGWALILPTNSNGNYQPVSGIFYPYLPDLPIARVIFLAGITVLALSLLGLPAGAGGPLLRRVAAAAGLAGLAVTGTAIGLAATARLEPHGMAIAALHDAANDRPIPYTPICGHGAGIPICLNPAYDSIMGEVASALRPVLAEVAGLPGAPVRAAQVGGTYTANEGEASQAVTISGHPPVLRMPLDAENLPGVFGGTTTQFAEQVRLLFIHAFAAASDGPGTPAQQAVQAALLQGAGVPFAAQPKVLSGFGLPSWALASEPPGSGTRAGRATGPVYAAARRLAALSPAARHAWLTSHLAALRAGRLSLAQLP